MHKNLITCIVDLLRYFLLTSRWTEGGFEREVVNGYVALESADLDPLEDDFESVRRGDLQVAVQPRKLLDSSLVENLSEAESDKIDETR